MPIDESKFLEPTQAYLKHMGKVKGKPKLWFNLDLIYIAYRYKDIKDINIKDKAECQQVYSQWLSNMDINYTFDEIYERFKDYPNKEFNKLLKVIMKHF